jgi:hypothetical protein
MGRRHQDQSEIEAFIFEHLPTESCLSERDWIAGVV